MKHSFVVWFVVTAPVYGNIMYIHKQRNASVEFSCAPSKKDTTPFAFSLVRVWAQPKEVLYQNLQLTPEIHDETDKHRISVQKDHAIHNANVSIANLRGRDTDMYYCVFHYEAGTVISNDTAETKFFLHVEDPVREPCRCDGYKLMVYSLSAATGLLFLCMLGFTVAYRKKLASHPKALAVPVYEEMNGVRQDKAKGNTSFPRHHFEEEADRCLYTQPQRKENPYLNSQDPTPELNAGHPNSQNHSVLPSP